MAVVSASVLALARSAPVLALVSVLVLVRVRACGCVRARGGAKRLLVGAAPDSCPAARAE